MITPEPLEKFRVAVPSEYEVNLLDALAAIGTVHLEVSVEARSVLPPLLVDALEGKITPQTLNITEALEIVRKVLRRDDILLKRFEDKVEQYMHLQKIRRLAQGLSEIGVSPDTIGKEKLGLITDLIIVSDENLHDAVSSFFSIGTIIRRRSISDYEDALLLIYKYDLKTEVEKLKKQYARSFEIPSWFYDKLEVVLKRIDEEDLSIRKELFDLLIEVAHTLRSAFEFEKASRFEIIGNVYKALKELRNKRGVIEDIIYTYAALQLILKKRDKITDVLSRLKIGKDQAYFIQLLANEEVLLPEKIEKITSTPVFKQEAEEIKDEISLFYKYLGIKEMASWLLKEKSCGSELTGNILFAYSEQNIDEVCESDYLKLYGGTQLRRSSIGWGCGVILLLPEASVAESLAEAIRARFNALVFVEKCSQPNLEQLIQDVEKKKNCIRNSTTTKALKVLLKFHKVDLLKLGEQIEDSSLVELASLYKRAFEEVKTEPLPVEERFTFLRNMLSSIDSLNEDLKRLEEDVKNILFLPTEDIYRRTEKILVLLKDILQKFNEYLSYEKALEAMYHAQPLLNEIRVLRTRRITYVEGYIPVKYHDLLVKELSNRVPRVLYLRFGKVTRGEKAPTYIETKGLKKYLYTLTSMRGTPSYWEIDPTLIFTGLFTIMYGMMFGDVGQGLLITIFGLWLLKTKYPLLGISRQGAATLGALATLAGASSMVFGAVYGMFFLKPLWSPLISPIHDIYQIIAVALWFGVIQLFLAMMLNTVNLLRFGDTLGAIFSGMGGMGILFYSSGIAIAYKLATSGFNFIVLGSPDTTAFLGIVILSLIGVLAFGFYEAKVTRHKEKLMHALSEAIEMIIAFPANSLSYIRLAAFAMAHEAFGILAENMALMTGELTSYIIANFLVLAIEALAVGIQALRLTYYEFSTKFFRGEGVKFRPLVESVYVVHK
ncbi:MAG: V-type ATPase 116kDa subunit family protein [Infirmifilum sp.]